jgi:ankyrin repeat protein
MEAQDHRLVDLHNAYNEQNSRQLVIDLLDQKVDPNAAVYFSQYDYRSPLIVRAVRDNDVELVTMILEKYRGDVNCTDLNSHSLVHLATQRRFHNMLRLLLSHGASPEGNDKLALSPLYVAAIYNEDIESTEILLQAGADSMRRTYHDTTVKESLDVTLTLEIDDERRERVQRIRDILDDHDKVYYLTRSRQTPTRKPGDMLRQRHEAELEAMRQRHEAELEAMRQRHEAELEALLLNEPIKTQLTDTRAAVVQHIASRDLPVYAWQELREMMP